MDLAAPPPYARHRIIGLVGLKGAGKDSAAHGLRKHVQNMARMSFASPLKDACASVFGWERALLEGDTPQSRAWRETVDPFWSKKLKDPLFTPRRALEKLGTEAVRDTFSPIVWVTNLEKRVLEYLNSSKSNIVAIPDTRFPNEIEKIRELGGTVIRIKRGDDPEYLQELMAGKDPATIEGLPHVSEWAFYQCEMDIVVENDGTLEDLANVMAGVYERLVREHEEHEGRPAKRVEVE